LAILRRHELEPISMAANVVIGDEISPQAQDQVLPSRYTTRP
jgi:hypothetical protein